MNGNPDNDPPPELLAGYIDGELPPDLAARVEAWLADNPDARDLLDTQATFSPLNTDFSAEIQIPVPSDSLWNHSFQQIVRHTHPKPVGSFWRPIAVCFTVACSLLFTFWLTQHRPLDPVMLTMADVIEEPEDVILAGDGEIEIVSLPESVAPLIVIGQKPFESDLVLAKSHELEFIGVGNDADGRFPEVPINPIAEDAPILWAPQSP